MWFWFALGSAIVSGASVTFNKKILDRGVHSSVLSLALFATVTLFSIPLLLSNHNSHVDATFFLAVVVSAVVFSISKTVQLNIFKNNDLSGVYPLAAIAPVTLYILSLLFLSEQVKFVGVIGILLMALGVYTLNFRRGNKNLFHPLTHFFTNKYSMMYVGAIVLGNISAISEKIAIKHTFPSGVFNLAFWENFFLTLVIGSYVARTNKKWLTEIKEHFPALVTAGVIFSLLYLLVMSGFKNGPISLVSAIKKLEVLFVLLISFLFLGDRPTKKVYFASLIMLLAVLLIKL